MIVATVEDVVRIGCSWLPHRWQPVKAWIDAGSTGYERMASSSKSANVACIGEPVCVNLQSRQTDEHPP